MSLEPRYSGDCGAQPRNSVTSAANSAWCWNRNPWAESGLIYMLNGATQHTYTDPFDRSSPAIPIGPHWMLIWPFDAAAALRFTLGRK
jgi:hypothetical protein